MFQTSSHSENHHCVEATIKYIQNNYEPYSKTFIINYPNNLVMAFPSISKWMNTLTQTMTILLLIGIIEPKCRPLNNTEINHNNKSWLSLHSLLFFHYFIIFMFYERNILEWYTTVPSLKGPSFFHVYFYINIIPSFKIIILQYLPLCYEYLASRWYSALLPRTVTKKHGVPPYTT